MRLVQNVQIMIILRDILINFPDFIETLSPLIRGGSKAGIYLMEHKDTETQSYLKQ